MNLKELQKFLTAIQDFDLDEFNEEINFKFPDTQYEEGSFRRTYLISKSVVVKVEFWCDHLKGRNQQQVYHNLYEFFFWKNANRAQRRLLCPCIWVSPNGRVGIFKRERESANLTIFDVEDEFITIIEQLFPREEVTDWIYDGNTFVNPTGYCKVIDYADYEAHEYNTLNTNQDIEDLVKDRLRCVTFKDF